MDENKVIKPVAKHVKHKVNILRPATDGHNLTGEIDPVLERNQPSVLPKLNLNPNAKEFIPKNMKGLYDKKPNDSESQKFKGINNYNNNNYSNMNMTPFFPYNNQQMNPAFMHNFNNFAAYNMQNPGNTFIPPGMNYPHGFNYPATQMNQGRPNYPNNNYTNTYPQNNNQNNYQEKNNHNYKNKESNNNLQKKNSQTRKSGTVLRLDSKSFIPKDKREEKKDEKKEENKDEKKEENKDVKKDIKKNDENKDLVKDSGKKEENQKIKKEAEKKEENKDATKDENIKEKKEDTIASLGLNLNIKAPPYKPRNSMLKQREDMTHPNKEEKEKKSSTSNTYVKKNTKKSEKKTEGINKNNEKKTKEENEEKPKKKEEKQKEKEREEKLKEEDEPIIERKYFITFKNKKSETNEKFTFEYIMQFKKWKICKEDDLLSKDVKAHFAGFKEEVKEGGKKKRDREEGNKKKENYPVKNAKESTPEVSLEKWARKDMTKEIKAAEEFKKKLLEEKEVDVIKKDLRDLLNKLTPDNYNSIKEQILEKIKDDVDVQNKFLDVLFQKAVLEKAYVKLYSKLVKELDKDLPQKTQKKDKTKKEYSEMRSHLIDKCRTIFQMENNEKFDEYIKEKDPEDRRNKLKKFFLGNVNFITELMKIKILSKKVGPDCLKNLYERCQKVGLDKTLRELTIEAIIVFTEKFGRIIYEEDKTLKAKDKEEYHAKIDDIFKKLAKIKEEKGLVGYIKYNIVNLEEKRKHNFAMSKFDESQIAKTKKQVEEELENEGQITQDNINNRMKNELKDYRDSLKPSEEEEEHENKNENDIWKETSFILEKRTTYGKTFGDILEGYFQNAADIIEEEKNPDYLKKYINELIDYYYDNFGPKDIKELRERLIKLFSDVIIDIALDIPGIYDLYAYVLNLFMEFKLMKFNDLAELKKGDVNFEHLSNVFKNLKKYYEDNDDFKNKLEELPYVKANKEKFDWAFE